MPPPRKPVTLSPAPLGGFGGEEDEGPALLLEFLAMLHSFFFPRTLLHHSVLFYYDSVACIYSLCLNWYVVEFVFALVHLIPIPHLSLPCYPFLDPQKPLYNYT